MSVPVDSRRPDLGPLDDGQRVAVIGGGPAGTSCAIALAREASRLGRQIQVVIYEPRDFPDEANVCVGVLSPPAGKLLADLGLALPPELIQQRIRRYILHTDAETLELPNPPETQEPTLALRRGDFDRFMLDSARRAGARIVSRTVTAFRIEPDAVYVTTDGENWERYAVLVCAFGLSGISLKALEDATPYRRPPMMRSLLMNLPLGEENVARLVDSDIHALLPASEPGIEFAALTPTRDHVTVNVAGPAVEARDLQVVLARFQALGLLPADLPPVRHLHNVFPAGPAQHLFDDRVVAVGNASGLLRPLKGKGINAALLTGARAARVILHEGISREAFVAYYEACRDITSDYRYGLTLRSLYRLARRLDALDPVVSMARHDRTLYRVFHTLVSGEGSYRDVVLGMIRPGLWARIATTVLRHWLAKRARGNAGAARVGVAPSEEEA